MEIQPPPISPIKMPASPTLSSTAVVSPETLSHHSSPAKTSRICYQQPPPHHLQHQVIDETIGTRMPLSISTHHQLASVAGISTPADHPHSSISGISGIHSDVNTRSPPAFCVPFLVILMLFPFFFCDLCSMAWNVNKCAKIQQQHKHHRQLATI